MPAAIRKAFGENFAACQRRSGAIFGILRTATKQLVAQALANVGQEVGIGNVFGRSGVRISGKRRTQHQFGCFQVFFHEYGRGEQRAAGVVKAFAAAAFRGE